MNETDNKEQSFEELMRLAQQGDGRAYAKLLRDITPLLRGFVSRRLFSPADVDDVVQEILLSIHRASHTYDTNRPFKVWMFAIARFRLTDHLRKIYRKGAMLEADFDDHAYTLSDTEDVTKQHEQREYLSKLLDSLPAKQRKIVTMMKIEGHSAAEVAKTMEMSTSAVKVSAHRAYKSLALKAEEYEE